MKRLKGVDSKMHEIFLKEIERLSDEDCEIIIEDNSCASNEAKLEPANHKPVVFVLEDFDKFSPQVLEDLVVSLK